MRLVIEGAVVVCKIIILACFIIAVLIVIGVIK